MTSSHWKVVCKQRLHCFDTSGKASVYHIKPQSIARTAWGPWSIAFYVEEATVLSVCQWSVTSCNRNYFLVKLRGENIAGWVAFWKILWLAGQFCNQLG